jgi:1-acyl-sn-glycerol-3-phosphate acyltransferase
MQSPSYNDISFEIYNTPPIVPGFFSRHFPSIMFYSRMFGAVIRAAREINAGHGNAGILKSSQDIARVARSVGARIIVENAEVFSRMSSPCIVAANHMSTLETMLIQGFVMPIRPMTFIAKKSLTKYPIFSTPLKACDPIIVGRRNARGDLRIMFTSTHDRISRGISVFVFPQTTRTSVFSPEHFNSIGTKLAKREGVPLLPLALKTDFWGCGKIIKDIGEINPRLDVKFRFGEPLDATDEREAHKKTIEFISQTLAEWGVKQSC